VRDAVGPDVDILVEVHGNLGTTSAIEMGRRLAELAPFFYEEPIDAMNVECMLKVSQNVPIPIAAGERLYTRYGFREYIETQAIDILQPDLGLTGGITEGKRIASFAEIYNLHIQPHNCGGPVSTAASVQLDACITNFIIQEWFPYRGQDFLELVQEPLEPQVVDSVFAVPDRPGLGLTLNEDAIARYPRIHIE
jgi:galactonate dehydratase